MRELQHAMVLVVNSGSSSFKYQLIDPADGSRAAGGLIDRIGQPAGTATHWVVSPTLERTEFAIETEIPDHTFGFQLMLDAFAAHGPLLTDQHLLAVGHRVVHGGQRFVQPTLITDAVEAEVEDLIDLAPLHNPGCLQGIRAARASFPDLPHVAVFDTAFHQTMPEAAALYAIDREVAERHRIRRYGFHGTSHEYVARRAASHLEIPFESFNAITLHLGNGCSACAIAGGRSVDTSMGLTPLEGLVMGTRSGDIDPGIITHLQRVASMSFDEIDTLLYRNSGLQGLTGNSDVRDVLQRAEQKDAVAELALEIMTRRIRHYVGAYLAQLGCTDAIVFTAGVGENAARVRADAMNGLGWFGIEIDAAANLSPDRGVRVISSPESRIPVLVIPTDEERQIAAEAARVVESVTATGGTS